MFWDSFAQHSKLVHNQNINLKTQSYSPIASSHWDIHMDDIYDIKHFQKYINRQLFVNAFFLSMLQWFKTPMLFRVWTLTSVKINDVFISLERNNRRVVNFFLKRGYVDGELKPKVTISAQKMNLHEDKRLLKAFQWFNSVLC